MQWKGSMVSRLTVEFNQVSVTVQREMFCWTNWEMRDWRFLGLRILLALMENIVIDDEGEDYYYWRIKAPYSGRWLTGCESSCLACGSGAGISEFGSKLRSGGTSALKGISQSQWLNGPWVVLLFKDIDFDRILLDVSLVLHDAFSVPNLDLGILFWKICNSEESILGEGLTSSDVSAVWRDGGRNKVVLRVCKRDFALVSIPLSFLFLDWFMKRRLRYVKIGVLDSYDF